MINLIYNHDMIAQQAINVENHLAKAYSIYDDRKRQTALEQVFGRQFKVESTSGHLTYLSQLQPTTK